ncbi:CDP-glycerol glycerophosphotransferase family protein, partial [Staphylococcus aureus]
WVASDYNKKKEFKKQLKKYRKIIVVVKESDEYLEALCTSKYIINNSTFPAYFSKKDEQIYINTCHGTPLKHMVLDVPDNLVGSQNVIKNFLSSNYIISPNAHTTRILNNAFRLSN